MQMHTYLSRGAANRGEETYENSSSMERASAPENQGIKPTTRSADSTYEDVHVLP
jgi:hypothetical protein